MWTPTHVQVTVHRARNLLPKGKGGTNDAYVTIQLGKDKYQTSVKERSDNPDWQEECDLPIPDMSGTVILNAYHRSFLGLDDFLGHVSIPLSKFQIYERPRSRWYSLKSKPGKKDEKYRGEIEVKVTFIVQSKSDSQSSLKIKRAGSIKNLANAMGEKLKLPVRSNSFRSEKSSSSSTSGEQKPLTAIETISSIKSPNKRQNTTNSDATDQESMETPTEVADSKDSTKRDAETPEETTSETINVSADEIIISFPPTAADPSLDNKSPPPKPPRTRPHRPPLPKGRNGGINNNRSSPLGGQGFLERSHSHISEEAEDEVQHEANTQHEPALHEPTAGRDEITTKDLEVEDLDVEMDEEITGYDGEIVDIDEREPADGDEARESPCSFQTGSDVESDEAQPYPVSKMMKMSVVDDPDSPFRQPECDLDRRWSLADPRPDDEEFNRSQTLRKPVYRGTRLKRAQSDADAKFVDRQRPISMIETMETPLLSDTREMARSLGKLNDDDLNWIGGDGSVGHSRTGSSSMLPESIPEETGDMDISKDAVDGQIKNKHEERKERIKKLRDRDNNRRHTLQEELPRITTHALHEGIGHQVENNTKENTLPKEIMDNYKHLTREDLVRMVHTQKQQVYKKDCQIKDLENYIDNLLVKVMDQTPRILQNPYASHHCYMPSTISITPTTTNIIIQTHGNNKTNNKHKSKHHSNPFKKLQAVLK